MRTSLPDLSVVICTRNRGNSIAETVESVLANRHPRFELIVIDQSDNDETQAALQGYLENGRFHYNRSRTAGLGISRNIGLMAARGKIVAFTDDDCLVQPDWLERLEAIFQRTPLVGLVYCQVDAAPHDASQGYIPTFQTRQERTLKNIFDCFWHELGIGAGMAVRKSAMQSIAGFDESLGAGAYFRSAEDRDVAIRLLLRGWWVREAADIRVEHAGFRTFEQGKVHTRDDFYGLGAMSIKPLLSGYWQAGVLLFALPRLKNWFEPLLRVLQLKPPHGLKKFVYFVQGIFKGMATPLDRATIQYRPPKEESWQEQGKHELDLLR